MMFIRKGFTLVEILIVIALIGIFAAATTYLMDDVRIEQTNSERLANNINDSLKNARNNMIVGKGVYTGGALYPVEKRTISIDPSGITTTYLYSNGTSTGTESILQWPFFDNDTRYQITDISVSSGRIINSQKIGWDHTGVTTADVTMLPAGDVAITAIKGGSIIPSQINTIRVTAGYAGMERSVILDRFIGSTEVIRGREGVDVGLIDPPVNGSCDNSTVSSCIAGTATGTVTVTCGAPTTWSCEGLFGGATDSSCSSSNPPCPVNGSCNNSVVSGCITGTATGTITVACGAPTTWSCAGEYGGTTDTTCNSPNTPCPQVVACGGSIPANATASTATTYTQTWNGSAWAPTTSWAESQATCDFNCNSNYTWNGSSCVANSQACAITNGAGSQTWNGSSWGTCNLASCNTNYSPSGNTCVANTQSVSCGGSIPANATASTATTYTQTWNGSAWAPTTSWAESQATCDFNCNSNYTWNGSSCMPIVNCSYVTYQGGSCSVSCGGGNYATYYTKTVVESGGGSCPIFEGQFAGYSGGSCNTGACACVPNGSCSASAPACGSTTYGTDNCGNSCSLSGPACAVNCSYTTYEGGSCNASCGGGNYATYYTKTIAESGGGSCPISEGQFAGYNGGSCNTQACSTSGPYSYDGWGACSVSCGGGTQTRDESCNYTSCHSPQPTSQSCNTQACASASCVVEKCVNYGPDIGQCGGGGGSEFDCQCQAYQNETLAHGASTTIANPNLFVGTIDCGGYVWDTGWACELTYSTVICDNGTIIY